MTEPRVMVRRVGREAQPLVVIDDFAPDPDALRTAAATERFGPAAHAYPGLRAPLPKTYWPGRRPFLEQVVDEVFPLGGGLQLIDASFSIVTRAPAALTLSQRLPHCDAHARDRVALVHYLSPDDGDGTAFFRHRSTGYETVDEARAPDYAARLAAELRDGGPRPEGYMIDDTRLFERIALAPARYNRALLYPSRLLHSGAISPGALLSPRPADGRLTVTAFLSMEGERR